MTHLPPASAPDSSSIQAADASQRPAEVACGRLASALSSAAVRAHPRISVAGPGSAAKKSISVGLVDTHEAKSLGELLRGGPWKAASLDPGDPDCLERLAELISEVVFCRTGAVLSADPRVGCRSCGRDDMLEFGLVSAIEAHRLADVIEERLANDDAGDAMLAAAGD
jgi:hypothetical protein